MKRASQGTLMAAAWALGVAGGALAQGGATPPPPPPPPDGPPGDGDIVLSWYTIDGGGRTYTTGGDFELGSTLGQPDAGRMEGDCIVLTGGFWPGVLGASNDCYANCDQSATPPILNVADFTCFLQKFAQGDCYANCDNSVTDPQLNVADFLCFLQKFAQGCP
jgi:hypothetical protein